MEISIRVVLLLPIRLKHVHFLGNVNFMPAFRRFAKIDL